jgi:CheY-like chemotaxis protein
MPRKVLIVDDYADNRDLLAMVLELQGFEVATATNGEEALVEAHRQRPCVILLDLMMPVMDGEQFRAAQMDDAFLREIPVIVISAKADGPEVARRMNAAGCLRKPVDFDDLSRSVGTHCPG